MVVYFEQKQEIPGFFQDSLGCIARSSSQKQTNKSQIHSIKQWSCFALVCKILLYN